MTCPKCGRPRVEGPECPLCGVVYAKFRPPPEPLPVPPPSAPPSSRARLPTAAVAVAALALIGLAGAATLRARRASAAASLSSSPEPGAPRASPPVAPPAADAPALAAEIAPEGQSAPAREPGPLATGATPAAEPASCGIYSLDDLPSAPRPPSVSSEWHEGASGFRRASAEQASSGAPLLLLFHVQWCPYCRQFIGEVVPSPEMRALGERVIKVKVDAEASADDAELAKRFSVKSYPTLLLIAAPGRAPVRISRGASPREFVDNCERALAGPAREHLDKGVSLSRSGAVAAAVPELKAAAGDPKLAPVALDSLGVLALGANCDASAVAIYGRVLELDPSYQGGRGYLLHGLARARSGDASGALEDAKRACDLGNQEGCKAAGKLRTAAR